MQNRTYRISKRSLKTPEEKATFDKWKLEDEAEMKYERERIIKANLTLLLPVQCEKMREFILHAKENAKTSIDVEVYNSLLAINLNSFDLFDTLLDIHKSSAAVAKQSDKRRRTFSDDEIAKACRVQWVLNELLQKFWCYDTVSKHFHLYYY